MVKTSNGYMVTRKGIQTKQDVENEKILPKLESMLSEKRAFKAQKAKALKDAENAKKMKANLDAWLNQPAPGSRSGGKVD